MNQNINYIGLVNLLRHLQNAGFVSRREARKIAAQLRTGLEPEACGAAFRVAAAWTALADLSEADRATGAESFSAGDLTVRLGAAGGEGAARLRQRARELLAPYRDGGGFAFRGVRG